MWQEMVITDLTRMGDEYVCIAGINHQGVVIRPEAAYGGVPEYFLYQDGKPFIYPRAVVKLNVEAKTDNKAPHLEDHSWLESEMTEWLRRADDRAWQEILSRTCYPSVQAIFETELLHKNRNAKPGTGVRSLGTVKPRFIHKCEYKTIERDGRVQRDYRLFFYDEQDEYFPSIKINDLTLQHYADHLHVQDSLSHEEVSEKLTATFRRGIVWLRLGLTRPFEGWCWLQVTGVYTFPDYLIGKCYVDFRVDRLQ